MLAGVEDVDGQPHVALNLEGEADTVLVPFAWMQDAKLTLSDELMRRGAEKRAARMGEDEAPDGTAAEDASASAKVKGRARPSRGAKPASHLKTSTSLPQEGGDED